MRRSRARKIGLTAAVSAVLAGGALAAVQVAEADTDTAVTVDFNNVIAQTPAGNIGFTASEFGDEGGPVPSNSADRTALTALHAGAVRIHLTPDGNGGVIGGAGGGDKTLTGDQWLDTYEAIGALPTVIVNLDVNDAVGVLNYLRANGHDVRRYLVGNEMDDNSKSNVSEADYITRFGDVAAAMRAIDPTLAIGAPSTSSFDALNQNFVSGLLALTGTRRPSFLDFHAYGGGAGETTTMDKAWRYDTQLNQLRSMIGDSSVGMEVGEYNINWSGDDPQENTQSQAVWMAAALGTILSHGAVAFEYADKNQALGLVNNGTPKASYWGLGMFTGAGLFRHFGTQMVATTSSDSTVRVFASTGGKNIVLVNTGTAATTASITTTGFAGGTAHEWQSTNYAPADLGGQASSGGYHLPANSVTTLVLDEPAGLLGSYYDTVDLTGTPSTRVDPTVNFNWGSASPMTGIGTDDFSARWTGYLTTSTTETYTFRTSSDDGVRLWVNGKLIVDDWTDHSWTDDTADVALTAGQKYSVKMEYYDKAYDAIAMLRWSSPSVALSPIPSTALSTG